MDDLYRSNRAEGLRRRAVLKELCKIRKLRYLWLRSALVCQFSLSEVHFVLLLDCVQKKERMASIANQKAKTNATLPPK